MSCSAPSELAQAQVPMDPKASWITPEEQLKQLVSPLANRVDEISGLIPDCANIVAQYAIDPKLTEWYTGLKRIGRLPKKLPPLPHHIHQILNSKCPGQICDKMKSDGTFYTVGEKCTLMLIPEELENINQFEKVIRFYGKMQYPRNKNPLQFRYFCHRLEYGNIPFGSTHWVLHTDDVLENSREKSYQKQADLVHSLAQETLVDWQIPNLQDTIATIFLKKIATRESLYPRDRDPNGIFHTYTRVREIMSRMSDLHLMVGCFDSTGLHADTPDSDCDYARVGIAALRKF